MGMRGIFPRVVLDVEIRGLAHVMHDGGPGHGNVALLLQVLYVCWPDQILKPETRNFSQ